MKLKYPLSALLLSLTLFGCSSGHSKEEQEAATKCGEEFANAFFNLRFKEAAGFCTPGSERFVRYQASILTPTDIETVRNADKGATVETNDFEWEAKEADTSAVITMRVNDFLLCDSIQRNGHIEESKEFRYRLVKRESGWKVDLEADI